MYEFLYTLYIINYKGAFMKKLLRLMTVIFTILVLTACGDNKNTSSDTVNNTPPTAPDTTNTPPAEETKENTGISVDKGLLDVELTLPAVFVGEDASGELTEENKKNGFKTAKLNEDGSVTYTISKNDYEKLLSETRKVINETLEKMPEEFQSIKKVEVNNDYSVVTFTVNQEAYESSFDAFAALGAYLQIGFYQALNGVEEAKLIVEVKDENSLETFATYNYPEDLG